MRVRLLGIGSLILAFIAQLNGATWPGLASGRLTTQRPVISFSFPRTQDDDPCPDPNSKVSIASRKAPTKEQYLALVAEVSKDYAAKIRPAVKIEIDQMLFGVTRAGYGSDIAALLLGIKEGSAAIYLNAWSAKKDPADFLTANNLGVELKGMNDLDRALSVMLYAQALEPDAPLTMDNTAWVDLKLGDAATAKGLFEKSVKLNPDDEQALAGLGLLAQCRGDNYEAAKYARQALKNKYLSIAAATLNSAEDDISGDSTGGSSDDDGGTPKPPPPPQPGKGSDFTAHESPIQNPRGKDGEGKSLEWKDPPLDPKIEKFVASLEAVGSWADDVGKAAIKAGQDLSKAAEPFPTKGNGPQRTGNTITIPNSYEKETFVLNDMRRIFAARIEIIMEDFNKRWSPLQEQADMIGKTPDCRPGRPKATTLHNQFVPIFNDTWTKIRKELNDYQAFAGPWLADIHDPDRNALENAISETWVRTFESEMSTALRLWVINMNILWFPGDPNCEERPAAAEPRPNPGPLKALKKFPEKCYVPTWFISTPALTYEATCDSLKLEVGKTAIVSAEYKFGNDWGDDQITLFGGLKAKKEIKGLPGGEVGAKIGPEWTINPATGETIDISLKSTISGKLTIGPKQESGDINPSGEVKLDGRIGLKNPNGNLKPGSKFGLKGK